MPESLPTLALPVPLDATHDLSAFDCGKRELNDFLQKYALHNQSGGSARTYVVVDEEAHSDRAVIAYYSLAPGSVAIDTVPARIAKAQPRHPVPVLLMARFAVDQSRQGKGVGRALFLDALTRSLAASQQIGGRAFFVEAKDEEARQFYQRFGMEAAPENPRHLFLLFKDVRRVLGR